MKADKLINAFRSRKDGATVISVKHPKQQFLTNFLIVFNNFLKGIDEEYRVESFFLSPRSNKYDIYHFKTNLPWCKFLEINK